MPTTVADIPRRPLGRTGAEVSIVGLGGYHLGAMDSVREAVGIVQKAVDAGITFLDNAWEYHDGKSEEIMGKALAGGRREKVFLMTKMCTHGRGKAVAMRQLHQFTVLWRTDTGALVRTLGGHEQAVVNVAFSPAGELLASGGDDSSIRLWRVRDGTLVNVLTGGSDHVYTLAFSPDGQWLASGGRERGALGTLWKQLSGNRLRGANGISVRLWRVRDGVLQQGLAGHSDDVWSVAFSPDGRWLATSSEDTRAELWRLEVSPGAPQG